MDAKTAKAIADQWMIPTPSGAYMAGLENRPIIERAEEALHHLGFRVCRVRHHDQLARVEIGRDEMAAALEPAMRTAIVRALKAAGYRYVTLDLQGYRTGSLNEGVLLRPA